MGLYRVGPVLLLAVLISSFQLAICESEVEEPVTIELCTDNLPESKELLPTTTEPIVTTFDSLSSLSDAIEYEADVNRFFDAVKKQMKCGYPKFGVPSLVPLNLSYKLKTSLDFLNLKKVYISATNFVIHGLDNFSWKASNTSFSRTKTNLMLNFPNVTIIADTSLNRANGTSRLSLYDTLVYLEAKYEEKNDLLYVTELDGDLALRASTVKIAHLFPKSAKLTKIWNKAISDSLPVVTKLITSRKLNVDFVNRILNGSKYYAMNTINTGLLTYRMNFDRTVESMKRFSEMTDDSLMCTESEQVGKSRVL
ncbi:uncharacterized protein LOC5570251 isoform X2 [Aedes aegypti]|uniref:Uncharacterized protein n=1 Tax=Aedes aegypti TaxID=7159 RepID=A0A6I8TFH5_AEDAE|nr:uncharacterized protein LOC5570251 isoform X2 [Aedes aegypti]